MPKTILLVDDDPTHRRLMQVVCEKAGYCVMQASSGQEAIDILRGPEGQAVSLMMLDLIMPDIGGVDTLEQVKNFREDLPVIILTVQGGIDTVVETMKKGACDFFVKPASPERVVVSIHNALNFKSLKTEVSRLKRKQTNRLRFEDIIGKSPALKRVLRLGERAAKSSIPILITGESGVGKEVIARAIQGSSDRAGRPFVTVNCGAIPENLVESTLFGHEKGAFTGATGKHAGKFQEASGGTIFLDEVGELPLEAQVKLLRVLQEGEVDPVGSKSPVKVDVRVISATNRELFEEVEKGNFREDLFYRLNVFPIDMPPLRERREDIPDLINYFISRYNAEENRDVGGVRHEVMAVLAAQPWPGNVRQLENAIFRAVVLSEETYLCADDFPFLAVEFEAAGVVAGPPFMGDTDEENSFLEKTGRCDRDLQLPGDTQLPGKGSPGSEDRSGIEENCLPALDKDGHLRQLDDIEGDLIALALERYNGQMSEVARRLGIGRSTLYRKVRDKGLDEREAG